MEQGVTQLKTLVLWHPLLCIATYKQLLNSMLSNNKQSLTGQVKLCCTKVHSSHYFKLFVWHFKQLTGTWLQWAYFQSQSESSRQCRSCQEKLLKTQQPSWEDFSAGIVLRSTSSPKCVHALKEFHSIKYKQKCMMFDQFIKMKNTRLTLCLVAIRLLEIWNIHFM